MQTVTSGLASGQDRGGITRAAKGRKRTSCCPTDLRAGPTLIPRQQFVEFLDGMFGDAGQDVGEPGLRVDVVHLGPFMPKAELCRAAVYSWVFSVICVLSVRHSLPSLVAHRCEGEDHDHSRLSEQKPSFPASEQRTTWTVCQVFRVTIGQGRASSTRYVAIAEPV